MSRVEDDANDARPRGAVRGWTFGLLLLCAGFFWVQMRNIDSTIPYPVDIDESFLSGPAVRMIQTHDLNPRNFTYPSLPKYLAALGMGAGFVRSASNLEIRDINLIGEVGYPYYQSPGVVRGARELFAILGLITLAATGYVAWHALQRPAAIFLAPCILATSPLFFYHSWAYLNVDIVGACFVMLTLAACLLGIRRPSITQSALIPGALAGLAAAGKYTQGIAIFPVLAAIFLYYRPGRRLGASIAAIAAMIVAFLVTVPYSLLDVPAFVSGLAVEAYHYTRGHPGNDAEPGLPQVLYYGQHLLSEFGIAGVAVAITGAFAFCVADWRRAVVLLAGPVVLGRTLIVQRTHFTRNALSLHPIVAIVLASGIVLLYGWLVAIAARHGWGARWVKITTAVVLLAAAIPFLNVREMLRDRTDSRKVAEAWIEDRLPSDWTIVIPSRLGFDSRALQARGRKVIEVNFRSTRTPAGFRETLSTVPLPAVMLVPQWGADPRSPGQKTADDLNRLARRLQVINAFGTNPVLVNYGEPVPNGNPAFTVAVIDPGNVLPR